MLKLTTVLISLIFMTGCFFNDPKYLRTNNHVSFYSYIIKRKDLIPGANTDGADYSFSVRAMGSDKNKITFAITGTARDTSPHVKVIKSKAKIIFKGKEFNSLSNIDEIFKEKHYNQSETFLEDVLVDIEKPIGLNWQEKLKNSEISLPFQVIIPIEINKYIYRADNMPVFDSHGDQTFERKIYEAHFTFEPRPIAGEPLINLRWLYSAY